MQNKKLSWVASALHSSCSLVDVSFSYVKAVTRLFHFVWLLRSFEMDYNGSFFQALHHWLSSHRRTRQLVNCPTVFGTNCCRTPLPWKVSCEVARCFPFYGCAVLMTELLLGILERHVVKSGTWFSAGLDNNLKLETYNGNLTVTLQGNYAMIKNGSQFINTFCIWRGQGIRQRYASARSWWCGYERSYSHYRHCNPTPQFERVAWRLPINFWSCPKLEVSITLVFKRHTFALWFILGALHLSASFKSYLTAKHSLLLY